MASYCAWDIVEICGPSASGLELVTGFVERCIAAGTSVNTGFRHVFVIFARVGSFSSLVSEDAELLYCS